jgi:hypothetical protein
MGRLSNKQPHKVVADAFEYKYVIAGRPKSGKTSLVHGIVKEKYDGDLSKLLLIAFEKGYKALNGIHADDIKTWEDFRELVEELVTDKDELPYKILALDTVDVMGKLAAKYVLKLQGRKDGGKKYTALNDLGYGKGHDLMETEMSEQLSKLENAGYSLIFITHDKDKQFESREGVKFDKTILSLGGRVRDLILNMVDFVVFVELGKELEKGRQVDKRYIYFRGDSGLEAGSRFKHVPNRIDYDFKGFVDTVEEAILAEYDGDVKEVEKAKKEQKKQKDAEVQEYMETLDDSVESPAELIAEIGERVKTMDKDEKLAVAEFFLEKLGMKDYRKSKDAEALAEVLEALRSRETE